MPEGRGFRLGVLSHHLLVAGAIDRFFADAARQGPVSTVVILSPRHYPQGSALVATSLRPWSTGQNGPAAWVTVNTALAKRLIAAGAQDDPDSFPGEHGIGTLVPFVAKYWPGKPIVPLVLEVDHWRPSTLIPVADALLDAMRQTPGLIVLVSTDFSHHHNLETTRAHDARTRLALLDPSGKSWMHIYGDNRPGYFMMARILQGLDRTRGHIAAHTDGHEQAGITEDITSYFFVYY